MGKQWNQCQTIFGGSQITADGDCSHEIKRHLLLGRKAMTNLGSILKSRGITLPTKVCLVKAMVFPVVMCGCESWTVKKAERRIIDAFELWCWRRLLRVPWTTRRSNQSILRRSVLGVHWKDWCWSLNFNTLATWFEDMTHWKDSNTGKDRRREEKGMTEHEMVGWHHWLNGDEFGETPGAGDWQGGLACYSPWVCTESDMIDRLNWTEPKIWRVVSKTMTIKESMVLKKCSVVFSPSINTIMNISCTDWTQF